MLRRVLTLVVNRQAPDGRPPWFAQPDPLVPPDSSWTHRGLIVDLGMGLEPQKLRSLTLKINNLLLKLPYSVKYELPEAQNFGICRFVRDLAFSNGPGP